MTFDFNTQYDIGRRGEASLDAFFSQGVSIQQVGIRGQKSGIDRVFSFRGVRWSVEYKTDMRAAYTKRVFVETHSSDVKEGWLYTSKAEYLLYYVHGAHRVYVVRMSRLRNAARSRRWLDRYPSRAVPNRGYSTRGIAVPLREFERIAEGVMCIPRQLRSPKPTNMSRHFDCWTAAEDARLLGQLLRGTALEDIARNLGRSVAGIRTRARRRGLSISS